MVTATAEAPRLTPKGNEFTLKPFQDKFIFSPKQFPAFVGPWAVGKSACAIFRGLKLSDDSSGNVGLICRAEYTDLRDSTIKDFERYTSIKVPEHSKTVTLRNGSIIMFRHAKELNSLQNINLGWFWIEQAEELPSDEQWQMLSHGRLRLRTAKHLTGFITANVRGHNWIWKHWKLAPPSEEYHLVDGMTTWDMEDILPEPFMKNLCTLEKESPALYRRFVMNDWDEEADGDILITRKLVESSFHMPGIPEGAKMIVCDPARYGDCKTVISIFQRLDNHRFAQVQHEVHSGWSTMKTAGRMVDLAREQGGFDTWIVDVVGIGSGIVDRLIEVSQERGEDWSVVGYNGGKVAIDEKTYVNKRSEDGWHLKQILEKGQLRLLNIEEQTTQISSIPYGIRSNGKRYLFSKEDLRKQESPSPDSADVVVMAASVIEALPEIVQDRPPSRGEEFWQRVRQDISRINGDDEGEFRDV